MSSRPRTAITVLVAAAIAVTAGAVIASRPASSVASPAIAAAGPDEPDEQLPDGPPPLADPAGEPSSAPSVPASQVDSPAIPTPAAPTDSDTSDATPIRIAFTGDVHGERQIAAAMGRGEQPLSAIAPALADADLTIVNLETAVGSRGTAAPKSYTFQAPPALLEHLVAAGVDIVNLANNHSLDYGTAGLVETLDHVARAGLTTVGAGVDDTAAYAPTLHEVRGRTVAVVGLTRVWPHPDWAATATRPGLAGAYDIHRAVSAVVEADRLADVVVVTVHWGTEGTGCPDEHQQELAAALRSAGADVVVGHHPHVLQGVQHRDGQLVAYSLGNFLWYTAGEVSRLSGVLHVTVASDGVESWDVVPAAIDLRDGGPRPATEPDAAEIRARLTNLVPGSAACPRP